MALSGTFQSSQVTDVGSYPSYIYVDWSATQNIANNTSTISWKCYGGSYYNNAVRWTTTGPVVVKINGQTVLNKTGRFNMTQGMLIGSGSLTVPHNTDGTKTVAVSISAAIYYGTTNSTYSGSISLNTIPRKSEITSSQPVTIGNKCNIKWTSVSNKFVYQLKFSLGSWSQTTDYIGPSTTPGYTYTGFTIPEDLYAHIPNDSEGIMTATLYTYSSASPSALIGTSKPSSFKVLIPNSVGPNIETLRLIPDEVTINGTKYKYLIQGVNKLTISAEDVSAGTGSKISSYTFSGPSVHTTQASSSIKIGPIYDSGTLKYKVTVKDTRKDGGAEIDNIIECYAYSTPSVTLKVSRKQKTITCTYKASYSDINGKNSANIKIYADGVEKEYIPSVASDTPTKVTFDVDSATKSYEIYAVITDGLGKTGRSNNNNVYGTPRVINITPDGTGIAFGKFAEEKNCVDVPKLKSRGNVELTTNGRGLHIKNSEGKIEPAIHRNTSDNLWIGATSSEAGHMIKGGTYISTGANTDLKISKPISNSRLVYSVIDAENYARYLPMMPTVLYSNSNGSKGTITLEASAANYSYLEIFYCEDNSYPAHQSVRYSRDMGSRFDISSIEATPTNGYVYLRTSRYNVSGKSITFARSKYVSITSNTDGKTKTPTVTESTTDNKFKITKVIGYSATK